MKSARPWPSLGALAFLLFLGACAASAFAAEAGEQSPAEAPIGTLFRWLNFVLVFGGLGYLIAKRAPAVFRGRAEAVSAYIADAAAAKAAAEQQLREAEEKLRRLDQEVAQMRAAARHESAGEAERLRALAREEAEKISRAATLESEAAERAARIELKAMAGRLAVERADAFIRQQITVDTRASLFHSFLDNLARSVH
jgi:F0F1-type ATP synthase membrane subunit b/b'